MGAIQGLQAVFKRDSWPDLKGCCSKGGRLYETEASCQRVPSYHLSPSNTPGTELRLYKEWREMRKHRHLFSPAKGRCRRFVGEGGRRPGLFGWLLNSVKVCVLGRFSTSAHGSSFPAKHVPYTSSKEVFWKHGPSGRSGARYFSLPQTPHS